ncbi:MAG: hypothetical protein ACYS26_15985 [Planctomycetota bacterium]
MPVEHPAGHLGGLGLDGAGSSAWSTADLPTDAALTGQQVALQAAVGPTATAPLGFDLSNGVLMTFGL